MRDNRFRQARSGAPGNRGATAGRLHASTIILLAMVAMLAVLGAIKIILG
ncbi:hypothetical protein [Metarhizobium album]|nr:hypothetical protein [Rhizobium album]